MRTHSVANDSALVLTSNDIFFQDVGNVSLAHVDACVYLAIGMSITKLCNNGYPVQTRVQTANVKGITYKTPEQNEIEGEKLRTMNNSQIIIVTPTI
ncbi:hypothetical protein M758_2G138700 [Ceratodon purpureus]|nr:hypothetical protein M758_2G138700 [Ceratodon purpureus]